MPRSVAALQWDVRHADPADRKHAGGEGGAELPDVPQHRASEKHDGPGRLYAGVPEAARACGEREFVCADDARLCREAESGAAPSDVPETIHADAGG